jgi:hypothetical protein
VVVTTSFHFLNGAGDPFIILKKGHQIMGGCPPFHLHSRPTFAELLKQVLWRREQA